MIYTRWPFLMLMRLLPLAVIRQAGSTNRFTSQCQWGCIGHLSNRGSNNNRGLTNTHTFNNIRNLWKSPYYRLDILSKFCISADSPSWAEQNGTNDFFHSMYSCWDIFVWYRGAGKLKFCDFWEWITWQPNMAQLH